jgi:hypothetical protein
MIDSYSKINVFFKDGCKKNLKKKVFFISIFEKKKFFTSSSCTIISKIPIFYFFFNLDNITIKKHTSFQDIVPLFKIFINFLMSFDPLENINHQIVHYFIIRVLMTLEQ